MARERRWGTGSTFAAIVFCFGASWLALAYFIPAPPSKITLATGTKGTTFNYFGERYKERFERAGIKIELRETAGGFENFKLLQDPNSGVDVAFVAGGVGDRSEAPHLLSAGTTFPSPSWLFYSSAEILDSLPQLKRKRIAIGPEGSGARQTAERILSKANVNAETATLLPLGGDAAVQAINDGRADAAFINSGSSAPAVRALLKNPRVRLMDLSGAADALSRIFPDVVPVTLPKGAIQLDPPIPAQNLTLISVPGKVLFRDSLHPAIVELLAKTMKEQHDHAGIFQRVGEFPTTTDSEFPMSPIVADYYKSGPSFLQGYLPFWMTIYAQRMIAFLIAAFAVTFPVFSFAPRLYIWFTQDRIRKLYRRLRAVEHALLSELTASQTETLQKELADIERETGAVAMRDSDLYFMLRYHIERTRSRLVDASQATHQIADVG